MLVHRSLAVRFCRGRSVKRGIGVGGRGYGYDVVALACGVTSLLLLELAKKLVDPLPAA